MLSIISRCQGFGPSAGSVYLDSTPLYFNLGVTNFGVVDNERIPARAASSTISPTNAVGALGLGVREEELFPTSATVST